MKRRWIVLGLVLLGVVLLSCLASAQETVTLRFSWWGGDSRHRATVQAIERYMELNPHVVIKPEYSGWDGYHDKLTTQYAARSAPDISQLEVTLVMEYAARGLIEEVGSAFHGEFKDIDESLWSMFIDESGQVWAIPMGTNTVSVHYNKTMFDDFGVAYTFAGWTWDDVYEIAKKMTKDINGDGQIDIYGINTLFTPSNDSVPVILYQWGGSFFRNNYTEPNLDSGALAKYLEMAKKFQDEKLAPGPDDIVVYTGSQNGFNQRKVAMNPAMISTLETTQALMDDEIGNVPWPKAPETGLTGTFLKPSQAVVINKNSKHKDEAMKFLEWFLTSPEAALITRFERGVPSSRTQRDALANADIGDFQRKVIAWTNECAEYVDSTPELSPPGFLEMQFTVIDLMQEVQYEVSTVDAVIKKMQSKCVDILNRYMQQ
ncbi:MAG: sugar ABC transporter substrate-binding protein [Firmicutes bacterium]|nr:sugar ABC transporter substrate-binding protein [Bacillota bacterium]